MLLVTRERLLIWTCQHAVNGRQKHFFFYSNVGIGIADSKSVGGGGGMGFLMALNGWVWD
jgi:hypothetical protein